MYMYIVYCILYIDIGDEINNSIIYFVQTNYSSCCSYLKFHFPKYLIFNAHGINKSNGNLKIVIFNNIF